MAISDNIQINYSRKTISIDQSSDPYSVVIDAKGLTIAQVYRKLRAVWSNEASENLRDLHGVGAEIGYYTIEDKHYLTL
jgi:hypothetical protein